MSKEKEALEKMFDLITSQQSFEEAQKCYYILEEALERLESIENVNPSEALEILYNNAKLDRDRIEEGGIVTYAEEIEHNEAIKPYYDTIKQALLKAQEPKHYLKWENLEFKNKQCIEYKVLLNGVEYYMFACDEDEEKYDSLSKYVMLSRVKVVNEMGKPVKGHEFFDCIEADKQFFNDLHLERVE